MTSTSGSHISSLQTPFFRGKKYEYWSLTMKALFRGQYVWEIVHNGYVELADQEEYNNITQDEKYAVREHRKKYGKNIFYINQAMHVRILPRVVVEITTKNEWDILDTTYQGLDKVNTSKLQILREILNLCP